MAVTEGAHLQDLHSDRTAIMKRVYAIKAKDS